MKDSDSHYSMQAGGSQYQLKGKFDSKYCEIASRSLRYGVTNANGRQLSARQNLKNIKLKQKKGTELFLHDNESFLFIPAGINLDTKITALQLKAHFLPTRTKYEYVYYKDSLQRIDSYGELNHFLGSYNFYYPFKFNKDPYIKVETHDLRSVTYRFKEIHKDQFAITEVISDLLPKREYEYTYFRKLREVKLISSNLPDSRYTNIQYYEKGDYVIWGQKWSLDRTKDSRFARVAVLTQPAGTDTSPVKTYSFIYHLKKDKVSSKPIGGYTEVFDAYGNRTIYCFSNEHRLTNIENFLGGENFYRREDIEWGEKGDTYTLLKKRSLVDSFGKTWLERTYKYDELGNALEEKLKGNLTGQDFNETYTKKFTYTKSNQIATEYDGRKEVRYTYYDNCDLIKNKFIVDVGHIRQRVFFRYDSNGVKIEEIVDDGIKTDPSDLAGATQRLIRRIKLTTDLPCGLPEVINELGVDLKTGNEHLLRKTVNQYSTTGNILHQTLFDCYDKPVYTKSWTYNSMGKVLSETDPLNQKSYYDYDANGNCIFKKTEGSGFHISFTYDFSNRLIREDEFYDDGEHFSKTYSYDLKGNKVSSTDIYGNITRYIYDELDRLVEVLKPNSHEKYTYDVLNNITSKTDGNGYITHFYSTSIGKPYLIQFPDGTEERSLYNLDGTLKRLTLPNGSYITYEYDYLQRNTLEATYSPDGKLIAQISKEYSAFQIISESDRKGNVTQFFYDIFGRLIKAKTHEMETQFVYDSLGRKSEIWEKIIAGKYKKSITVFDFLDRVVEERVEDEKGKLFSKKTFSYDVNNNIIKETVFSSTGSISKITEYNSQGDPERITDTNGETTYHYHNYNYYNELGQAVAMHETIDPKGNRIKYIYTVGDQLAKEVYFDPCGNLVKKLSYQYDNAGNLIHRFEEIIVQNEIIDSVITTLEYDTRNREVAIIKAYGRPEQKIFRKEYTHFDKISKQIKPDGVVIHYTYDFLGRLTEVFDTFGSLHYVYTYDLNDNVLSVTDKISNTTTLREFDKNDLIKSEKLDNELYLKYEHDLIGRITKLTLPDSSSIQYTHDARNVLTVERNSFRQTYNYDLTGKILSVNNPSISYHYDKAMRLTKIESDYFSQEIPEYDPNNNILRTRQKDSLGLIQSTYNYDSLNQLTSETGIENHTYEYDSRENRTKKDDTDYQNDILSQLVKQGNTYYGYDSNGNRISADKTQYEYDALDRLIAVTKKDVRVEYKYDAFNRRVSKTSANITQNYFYCMETEIGSSKSDGTLHELMVLAGSKPAFIEIDQNVYLPIQDHRGNIVTLIDPVSQVSETYRYSAFGEEITDSAISPWRFSCKRVDSETGLVFFGRRYYDPGVGRWITPDPVWFEDGPNLYAYVHNNPLIFIDPNGLSSLAADNQSNTTKGHLYFKHYEKIAYILRYCTILPFFITDVADKRSFCYPIPGRTFNNITISHMNGIFNTFKMAQASARTISDMAGGCEVKGVYNCSYSGFDLIECALGLCRLDTDPVKKLHALWDEALAKGDNSVLLQYCHSQGAIHVRNALETYDPEKRKRIHVIAVAPGAYIDKDICGSIIHLVSKWDIVPWFDYFGRRRCKDTIELLDRHPDASYFDHNSDSPTYRDEIQARQKTFIEMYERL